MDPHPTVELQTLAVLDTYAAVGVTVAIGIVAAIGALIVCYVFGPKRRGPVKDTAYECGVPVLADTQRRLHIRFYLVAVLFMLLDVEVIFLWPWATAFYKAAAENITIPLADGTVVGKGFLAAGMAVFFVLLVFGLLYEWKRGAFRWD